MPNERPRDPRYVDPTNPSAYRVIMKRPSDRSWLENYFHAGRMAFDHNYRVAYMKFMGYGPGDVAREAAKTQLKAMASAAAGAGGSILRGATGVATGLPGATATGLSAVGGTLAIPPILPVQPGTRYSPTPTEVEQPAPPAQPPVISPTSFSARGADGSIPIDPRTGAPVGAPPTVTPYPSSSPTPVPELPPLAPSSDTLDDIRRYMDEAADTIG